MKSLKIFIILFALAAGSSVCRSAERTDSAAGQHRALRELEVMGVKQGADTEGPMGALTLIGNAEAARLGVHSAKGLSQLAPNFFMPDYGSRITSSIYVRGLGSRMDQPVVGMMIDGVPILNKDAYDFDVDDVQRIEMWRGAQSVINGRNAMAGQVNIYTRSPWSGEKLRLMASYGRANTWQAGATWRTRMTETVATSLSAYMRGSDGFFRNAFNNSPIDHERQGSARWKTAWRPSAHMSLTNTASASVIRQGGYPYRRLDQGIIARNDTCFYRRTYFSDGVTISWGGRRVVATSLTSVQYLDDNMTLDQDFTTDDMFTLTQKKREWGFTEDLFCRGSRGRYSWLGGVFAFYRPSHMDAPVHFKDQGIATLIEDHRNQANPAYPIAWYTRRFSLGSDFDTRNGGVALYHESRYENGPWTVEGAIRLDYEHNTLHWHSECATGYRTLHRLPDGSTEPYRDNDINIDERGTMKRDFVQLLPKVAASYRFSRAGSVYMNVAKGYKAGGFNLQMFSDVLQQKLMSLMGFGQAYNPDKIVSYRPEVSWNYEIGTNLTGATWSGEATVFFIDTRDRQLTTFPPGMITGRMMTNAARTHSYGLELSGTWQPAEPLTLRASYGYTHAEFRKYMNGDTNLKGRILPYAPAHTVFASAEWRLPLHPAGVDIAAGADVRGAGPIYWDDENTVKQNFYATLGANVTVAHPSGLWQVKLWGENLTDTRYDTFYFVSMQRAFLQPGKPWQAGVTIRVAVDLP
ncbi:MAG: TonB-dependent receptor [Muribaculaceae bacterium]|nr:TonB-dependent receptor [Muribaculaceae bacterium]